jgi:hypothetical protein
MVATVAALLVYILPNYLLASADISAEVSADPPVRDGCDIATRQAVLTMAIPVTSLLGLAYR